MANPLAPAQARGRLPSAETLCIGTDHARTHGEVTSFIRPTDILGGNKSFSTQPFPGGMMVPTPSAWERCWFVGWPRKKRQIPTLWCTFLMFYTITAMTKRGRGPTDMYLKFRH